MCVLCILVRAKTDIPVVLYLESVADPDGGKSGHGPPSSSAIDFGPSSNEEIYVRYWKIY